MRFLSKVSAKEKGTLMDGGYCEILKLRSASIFLPNTWSIQAKIKIVGKEGTFYSKHRHFGVIFQSSEKKMMISIRRANFHPSKFFSQKLSNLLKDNSSSLNLRKKLRNVRYCFLSFSVLSLGSSTKGLLSDHLRLRKIFLRQK